MYQGALLCWEVQRFKTFILFIFNSKKTVSDLQCIYFEEHLHSESGWLFVHDTSCPKAITNQKGLGGGGGGGGDQHILTKLRGGGIF